MTRTCARPIAAAPRLLVILLIASLPLAAHAAAATSRLPGHVLGALSGATRIASQPGAAATASPADDVLTLTLVLARDDEAAFQRYLRAVYDPGSASYRRFLRQSEIAQRFGPSRRSYQAVEDHLVASGLTVVERSANRLTLTVRGSRADVERAFDVRIRDYRLGDRVFYANDRDPALPTRLAAHVASVAGLSNLARVARAKSEKPKDEDDPCVKQLIQNYGLEGAKRACNGQNPFQPQNGPGGKPGGGQNVQSLRAGLATAAAAPSSWLDVDGSGQTVGLVAFDTFSMSDVVDYLAFAGLPASVASQIQQVHVNGGAAPGAEQAEVLLDIVAVLTSAPGASIVVYDAPFTGAGSFQAVFNRMLDDGVDIISNSWVSCESRMTLADVQGIEAIFQSAALAQVSVFNATGDHGSTCADGSPSTLSVPAGSPSATAVGGTTRTEAPGRTYAGETWWDGADTTPPTGQGGFGTSRFFARPGYQDGFTGSATRSIPDVVMNADPAGGVLLCQASAGGCPTGSRYGGTSYAAPVWAGFTALLNQAQGSNLGFLNPLLYPLAGTDAFHPAAGMGSDFAHVGLGSPNLNELHRALAGKTVGPVDAAVSSVEATADAPADGVTESYVIVRLRDASGHSVSGKTVTLVPTPGSDVEITPPSGVSTVANGAVVFAVKDLTAESVELTATDTTDGVVLSETATVEFEVPPAASGGISASPTSVAANGTSTTTITVTLEDALGRPTPGKLIALSQGSGHSLIQGPSPAATDANGQIQFTATNTVDETVTYTAVDVTDGELPVPGAAQVTFSGSVGGCVATLVPPVGANGFVVDTFASGFEARDFVFGGVFWSACPGASNPAFEGDSVFIADFPNGSMYELGPDGGAVTSADVLATVGPTLGEPVFGKDGSLYATRGATTGNFTTGAILQLDPETGAVIRTVASNLTCPNGLAVDPLSGDLFFDDACTGGGADNPNVFRVVDPSSPTPSVVVYATMPDTPNGRIAFAPNGTLYTATDTFANENAQVYRIGGTDQPQPPTVTPVAGVKTFFSVTLGEVLPSGEAKSLIVHSFTQMKLVDITTDPPTTTVLANGTIGTGAIGPDGCLYVQGSDKVYRLRREDGGCGFTPTSPRPSIRLSPPAVAPDPEQGGTLELTASFENVDVPEGTPVFFDVGGANPRRQMVRTDASGAATFAHTGAFEGEDVVVASATVDGSPLTSNRARVTWGPGRHVTFLTLNASRTTGAPGETITVRASLTDSSTEPRVPVGGATIAFTLGGAQCSAETDANGIATCPLAAGPAGVTTLAAQFAGTAALRESSAAIGFHVFGEVPLDTFAGYRTVSTKGTPKLAKFGPVTLEDSFRSAAYDVTRILQLAAPAARNGVGAADPETFLEAFAIKPAKGSAKFAKRTDLVATNQCGSLLLTATKPASVLVPTAVDRTAPAAPPEEGDHNVDHFLCYQAKVQKKHTNGTPAGGLPKGLQADVVDALDPAQTRRYDLKRVTWVCNPTAKSGSPVVLSGPQKGTPVPITPAAVRNPESHLVCYAATLAKRRIEQNGCGAANPADKGTRIVPEQPKPQAQLGLFVASQLGAGRLDAKNGATVLCIPSAVEAP